MSFAHWMSSWPLWIMSWRTFVTPFTWFSGTITWLFGSQRDKISIEDIESGQKGSPRTGEVSCETLSKEPRTTYTTKPTETTVVDGFNIGARIILGAGSSSVVRRVDGNKAEKRFESLEDLLNEQTIYQILGSHPRLLSIYHIGADSITMELMKQGDLARFIQSNSETTQHRKHQWITQIAESFNLLHTHHISHCDSKLENFLLDDNYDIKICDFASSHNYRAPSNDLAIQPLNYRRAIDDFDPAVFNPADDIFAFGSICYEIITGGPPYAELDDESVMLQFTRGDFPTTEELSFGPIISDCWNGKFISFEAILRAIENEGCQV